MLYTYNEYDMVCQRYVNLKKGGWGGGRGLPFHGLGKDGGLCFKFVNRTGHLPSSPFPISVQGSVRFSPRGRSVPSPTSKLSRSYPPQCLWAFLPTPHTQVHTHMEAHTRVHTNTQACAHRRHTRAHTYTHRYTGTHVQA